MNDCLLPEGPDTIRQQHVERSVTTVVADERIWPTRKQASTASMSLLAASRMPSLKSKGATGRPKPARRTAASTPLAIANASATFAVDNHARINSGRVKKRKPWSSCRRSAVGEFAAAVSIMARWNYWFCRARGSSSVLKPRVRQERLQSALPLWRKRLRRPCRPVCHW
jgi:hypothetical protein